MKGKRMMAKIDDMNDAMKRHIENALGAPCTRYNPKPVDQNCLSYWFPKLDGAGLPVPKTKIIRHTQDRQSDLMHLCDGKTPERYQELVAAVSDAAKGFGAFPVFLRTGQSSGKHEWKNTCCLQSADGETVARHIANLVNFHGIFDLDYDVWVVREWLSGPIAFFAEQFDDMPVRREFRCFVDGPEVVCVHPYWPKRAFEGLQNALTKEQEAALNIISDIGPPFHVVTDLASRSGATLEGQWSIDILDTDRGWFITDCSIASCSFHWDGCENAKRFE